jgi:hypothetical protein
MTSRSRPLSPATPSGRGTASGAACPTRHLLTGPGPGTPPRPHRRRPPPHTDPGRQGARAIRDAGPTEGLAPLQRRARRQPRGVSGEPSSIPPSRTRVYCKCATAAGSRHDAGPALACTGRRPQPPDPAPRTQPTRSRRRRPVEGEDRGPGAGADRFCHRAGTAVTSTSGACLARSTGPSTSTYPPVHAPRSARGRPPPVPGRAREPHQ